jgi:hypothetical protein
MNRLASADLASAHLVLSAVVVLWNIAIAGRIARMPDTPFAMGALSAVGGLVIAPALFVVIAAASLLSGRALHTIAWIWPATALLMTVQASLALYRGRVALVLVAPILLYNATLTIVYGARYLVQRGIDAPDALLAISAAQTSALAIGAHPMALFNSLYLHVPMLAPATPGRRGAGTLARSTVAALAAVWLALILIKVPEGVRAVVSYAQHGTERLQERAGDFHIGLKLLPTLTAGPPPLALQSDLAMVDTTGVTVMSVYLAPGATSPAALEDLAAGLDARRGGRMLIVALDLSGGPRLRDESARDAYFAARLPELERTARVLRPDYVVPVLDPHGSAARSLGAPSGERWRDFHTAARAAVRRGSAASRVMLHVGGYTEADSALYAWGAGSASPVDAVALSIFPGYLGGSHLDATRSAAARWLRAAPDGKEHWVLESGALPLTHGDRNQTRTLWATLAWASQQPLVRGVIIYQASDYESPTGLRAPGGRIRAAAYRVAEAVRAFDEVAPAESDN